MRSADIFQEGEFAGILKETSEKGWTFTYDKNYNGIPVSLTLPVQSEPYFFYEFPPVFEGLLPEGIMQDNLLRRSKIDKNDYYSQLIAVGADLVGSVTVYQTKSD